ncbi:MAG: deoxyribodipyrimidine photo-lyase [Flavobacteriales bacterium]|nr:deoxyribodipyrimidine photo-lyase [Flavobacteriales bacterium]MCB9203987.1 deoxyribodipyrimidine photo-lyase [Flavobacteriales bacterium]
MKSTQDVSVFWFRRDLRLDDNAGLYHALRLGNPVLAIFIFDEHILSKLEDKADKRVDFIHRTLEQVKGQLRNLGSDLLVIHGTPLEVYKKLISEYSVKAVFTNHDYEPYAQERDKQIAELLKENGSSFQTSKDQCIFEKDEVLKDDGKPYTVYTPYSKKWKGKVNDFYLSSYPTEKYFGNFLKFEAEHFPSLEEIGFEKTDVEVPSSEVELDIIKNYHNTRDIPSIHGTSRLSVHLRFGTISIRKLARMAQETNGKFLNELIWRDFYMMILWHFPHVVGGAFKPQYDQIEWERNEKHFEAWCKGETGYPIVDAGMRELNGTGWMHNRVRMVVASFLTKHLLLDWRWGEAYFAKKLLDFELSSNNGGWQWAAGSGCDAAPYFRVFNPDLQTQKFDPRLKYIQKWVPEFQELTYPRPIVEHKFARERALDRYKSALK